VSRWIAAAQKDLPLIESYCQTQQTSDGQGNHSNRTRGPGKMRDVTLPALLRLIFIVVRTISFKLPNNLFRGRRQLMFGCMIGDTTGIH
jgi:hypothetical protein